VAALQAQQKVFALLDGAASDAPAANWVNLGLLALIVANVLAAILETLDPVTARYGTALALFEAASIAVFTAEFALRVWAAGADPSGRYAGAVGGRLRYIVNPVALTDLLAILPFYLPLIGLDLRVLRLFRVLHMTRASTFGAALETLAVVVRTQRRALLGIFVLMTLLLVLASTLVYHIERQAQPEAFASIPHAMWWGVVTLTTVGYGDVTPVTPWGRIVGAVVTLLGYGMFTLPAAVLAAGFISEIRRRDFVVSWNLVAQVPLFAGLDAARIAAIATLLQPRLVPPRHAIVRRGEMADAMYFIAEGEVEVELASGQKLLGPGQFFGEVALVEQRPRTATVTALTETRLMVLTAKDFAVLMQNTPELRGPIEEAASRRGHDDVIEDEWV
jgi:voltage-gated potassium channel